LLLVENLQTDLFAHLTMNTSDRPNPIAGLSQLRLFQKIAGIGLQHRRLWKHRLGISALLGAIAFLLVFITPAQAIEVQIQPDSPG